MSTFDVTELEEMTPSKWDGKSRDMLVINGHSYYQYDDVDNLCTKFIKAMKKLIEENNRLKSEKHDMESPLNTCDNECGNSLVTGTIDESNEVLHTCIADPKSCHCNNSTRKYRRMTHRELAEWLAKGNGQYRFSSALEAKLEAKFEYIYYCDNDDATVQDNISIRAWNEQIWHEPVIEE